MYLWDLMGIEWNLINGSKNHIYSDLFWRIFLAYINSLTWKSMNIAEMLSHLSVIPLNPTHNSSDETRRAPYGIGTAGIKKNNGKKLW